jgi:hypothetical protein
MLKNDFLVKYEPFPRSIVYLYIAVWSNMTIYRFISTVNSLRWAPALQGRTGDAKKVRT